MMITCPICKTSYSIKTLNSRETKCTVCAHEWSPNIKTLSTTTKTSIIAGAFIAILLVIFAVFFTIEKTSVPTPMVIEINGFERAVPLTMNNAILVRATIKNQTDNMMQIPKIVAVLKDGTGAEINRISFFASAPMLLGGENIAFSHNLEYNENNIASISLEFEKQ
jgi:hypothetical protein